MLEWIHFVKWLNENGLNQQQIGMMYARKNHAYATPRKMRADPLILKLFEYWIAQLKKFKSFSKLFQREIMILNRWSHIKKLYKLWKGIPICFSFKNSKLFSAARILVLLVTKQLAKKVCSKDRIQSKLIKKVVTQLLVVNWIRD